jgi:hypothetical protein
MFTTTDRKIIAGLLVLVVGGLIAFNVYRHQKEAEKIAAQNELARLIPLQVINDSLNFKFVRVSSNLSDEIAKTSQLRKLLAQRDEKILMLASVPFVAKVESVYITLQHRPGQLAAFFDTTSEWWSLSGFIDTSSIIVTAFEARDSLTIAVTRSVDDLLYGYVQNHSPFVKVKNADFVIDAGQFIDKPSPLWKYAAIGEAVLLVLKFLK